MPNDEENGMAYTLTQAFNRTESTYTTCRPHVSRCTTNGINRNLNGDVTHMGILPQAAWDWYYSSLDDDSRATEHETPFSPSHLLFHSSHIAMRNSGTLILDDETMPEAEHYYYLEDLQYEDVIKKKRGQYVVVYVMFDNDLDIPWLLAYRMDGSIQIPERCDGLVVIGDLVACLFDAVQSPDEYTVLTKRLLQLNHSNELGHFLHDSCRRLPPCHPSHTSLGAYIKIKDVIDTDHAPSKRSAGRNVLTTKAMSSLANADVVYSGTYHFNCRKCQQENGDDAGFLYVHAGTSFNSKKFPHLHVVIHIDTGCFVYASTHRLSETDPSIVVRQACAKADTMTDAALDDVNLLTTPDIPDEWTAHCSFHAGELIGTPLMMGSALFSFLECTSVREILDMMKRNVALMSRPMSESITADVLIDLARHIRRLIPHLLFALSVWSKPSKDDVDRTGTSSRMTLLCTVLSLSYLKVPAVYSNAILARLKASAALLIDSVRDIKSDGDIHWNPSPLLLKALNATPLCVYAISDSRLILTETMKKFKGLVSDTVDDMRRESADHFARALLNSPIMDGWLDDSPLTNILSSRLYRCTTMGDDAVVAFEQHVLPWVIEAWWLEFMMCWLYHRHVVYVTCPIGAPLMTHSGDITEEFGIALMCIYKEWRTLSALAECSSSEEDGDMTRDQKKKKKKKKKNKKKKKKKKNGKILLVLNEEEEEEETLWTREDDLQRQKRERDEAYDAALEARRMELLQDAARLLYEDVSKTRLSASPTVVVPPTIRIEDVHSFLASDRPFLLGLGSLFH
jgi:hypothetical protein